MLSRRQLLAGSPALALGGFQTSPFLAEVRHLRRVLLTAVREQGALDLFRQPPGFTVAFDAQGARDDESIRRQACDHVTPRLDAGRQALAPAIVAHRRVA